MADRSGSAAGKGVAIVAQWRQCLSELVRRRLSTAVNVPTDSAATPKVKEELGGGNGDDAPVKVRATPLRGPLSGAGLRPARDGSLSA